MDDNSAFQLPTDEDISAVEAELNFTFPAAYKNFLKSGGNVENALYEPALVRPGVDRLYLVNLARDAWAGHGISGEWLPFIEENGDYFLLSSSGEVRFWSHNGAANETWSSFMDWFQQCCVARR